MINSLNSMPVRSVIFKQTQQVMNPVQQQTVYHTQYDNYENSPKSKQLSPPDIGTFRLLTGFLTNQQVEDINRIGMLPPNAKFVMNGYGGYEISNNFMGIRVGTQVLPQVFEGRKNVIGQAVVLPKGCNGLLLK